jgi:hypothetical protein
MTKRKFWHIKIHSDRCPYRYNRLAKQVNCSLMDDYLHDKCLYKDCPIKVTSNELEN